MRLGWFDWLFEENPDETFRVYWLGTPIYQRAEIKHLAGLMGLYKSDSLFFSSNGCSENSLGLMARIYYDQKRHQTVMRVYVIKPPSRNGDPVYKKKTFTVEGRYW